MTTNHSARCRFCGNIDLVTNLVALTAARTVGGTVNRQTKRVVFHHAACEARFEAENAVGREADILEAVNEARADRGLAAFSTFAELEADRAARRAAR